MERSRGAILRPLERSRRSQVECGQGGGLHSMKAGSKQRRQAGSTCWSAPRSAQGAAQRGLDCSPSAPNLVETLLEIGRRCSSLPELEGRSTDDILGFGEIGGFP